MAIKLSDIKPNPNNPRKISGEQLSKLRESLERDPEFMQLRPIVVDESGLILGGNQRYAGLKSLGYKEVPESWVVKADSLTEEQQKRFILVDNAPEGMAGEWDVDLLKAEWDLPELEDLGFDLDNVGGVELIDSDGPLGGGSYGDVSGDRIPINILGIGGLMEREMMELVKKKLIDSGADTENDNVEQLSVMFLSYLGGGE